MAGTATIALIPARGGSKGVPGKNLRPLGGYPLIAYSILAGRLCAGIDRVVVTTDSEEIAAVARRFGAEVPFLRPAELAGDRSPDRDFVVHALDWFLAHEGEEPDLVVHLRPTTPLRDPALVGEAIGAIRSRAQATALRSAHPMPEPPQKMLGIEDGWFVGLFPQDPRPEYYNLPRQSFPPTYYPNGYVDILRTSVVRGAEATLHGRRIQAFVTPLTLEVDTIDELELLQYRLDRDGHPLLERLRADYPDFSTPGV